MRTILISAYACEPLKGSEQGVGWNWVLQIAKKNHVHVITRTNNQESIEAHLPKGVAENITFHYYDTHSSIKGLKNKAKGLYFYYFCWQLGTIPLIRRLTKKQSFDYSIHLTFGSMWMPTVLPFFNIPFIWGPVGGGDGEPNAFFKILPIKDRLMRYVRSFMNKVAILNPSIFIPGFRSIAILVRTENSASVIPKIFRSKIRIVLETAMEPEIFNVLNKRKNQDVGEIRLITTGRLMPSKNILTAIRSLSFVPSLYKISLVVIGSGPEKLKIEEVIKKSKESQRIKIISEVPRAEVLKKLSDSDIYLFPSLREGGSWALMEAMATGLPVVCLKWSGMEIITDDASAIRLPVTNPEQMSKDMAAAICKLIDNPTLRQQMGNAARERIKNVFNWEAKGEFMESLFDELDGKRE